MSDAPQSVIAVVLFTDLIESTRWKEIGNQEYTAHIRLPHDALFRELLARFPGAVERDNAGDGFLATFRTPSDAVRFAVQFHRALAAHEWPEAVRRTGRVPSAGIGIHLGEVVEFLDAAENRKKVSGLELDLAARILSIAGGGRTLLTRHAADTARQNIRDEPLGWAAHGHYRAKGNENDPLEVFEVGADGTAFPTPPDSEKVKRVVIDPTDDTGRWRPAAGLGIPGRDGWVLESQLGEGGFGEVWLGKNKRTKEVRVFKFCFDAGRLRSFKRELTFYKLIQSELGHRPDFAKLLDVQVEKPPYSLEGEYVTGGNLAQWVEQRGGAGMADWPLADRLRFLGGAVRAVADAHALGIIHKDLKPSNVFVREADGGPQPVLADFGIGVLTDRTALNRGNVTETGFTEPMMFGNDSSRTGTRLYSPPEALAGKTATTGFDVYALGVMLFQLTAGDFHRPLGTGWGEAIRTGDPDRDALLTEDITAATFADPARRLATAAEFADRLNRLDARVAERKEQAAAEERERVAAERVRDQHSIRKALSTYISFFSHDIRMSNSIIRGYAELLLEEPHTAAEVIEFAGRIRSAQQFLHVRIEDLFEWLKFFNGQIELSRTIVNPASFLDELVEELRAFVEANGNCLERDFQDVGDCRLDAIRVKQVMYKLIRNAAKFTFNGVVRVTLTRQTDKEGEWIEMAVSDTGSGIRREDITQLFEPFVASDDRESSLEGKGLGLRHNYRLCKQMGGEILAFSDGLGKGSTFTVRLPIDTEVCSNHTL